MNNLLRGGILVLSFIASAAYPMGEQSSKSPILESRKILNCDLLNALQDGLCGIAILAACAAHDVTTCFEGEGTDEWQGFCGIDVPIPRDKNSSFKPEQKKN